MTRFFFKTSA